ncbi:MAG: sulfite exporter TauE/SafE family protein [Hyphomicrobiales bacterium]|nr:sulfite exporter TauE/SafE family protein [Hyphomicrobiales bacterium]
MDLLASTLLIAAVLFIFAGGVKGLIGVGLPTVAIALLINLMPLSDAVAVMFIPAFVSNVWQASSGGNAGIILKRFWPFLLCLFIGTWFGVSILVIADPDLMAGLFGLVLSIYSALSLARPAPLPLAPFEVWLSPVLGAINGLISGMTGSYLMPGVLYMQALGLRRDELIQAMGVFFLCAVIALGVALAGQNVMQLSHAGYSLLMLPPTMAGYFLGERYRKTLPEETFRKVFFAGLLMMGLYTVITRLIV